MTFREQFDLACAQGDFGHLDWGDAEVELRGLWDEADSECAECSSPGVWESMHDELVSLRKENKELRIELSWMNNPERMGR